VGPKLKKVSLYRSDGASMGIFWAPGCSSWLPGFLGTEVGVAQYDYWRGSFTAWVYLAAKPSHVGVDVDGLAYPLPGEGT
jgi:hypothetical protein